MVRGRTVRLWIAMLIAAVTPISLLSAQEVTPDPSVSVEQPPSVTVSEQLSLDGTVTVDSVFSPGPGWIAIHADVDNAPGSVIGWSVSRSISGTWWSRM